MLERLTKLQSANPNLIAWCIILAFAIMLGLLIFYIPRIKTLKKLQKENRELRAKKDYALQEWAKDLLARNAQVSDYEKLGKDWALTADREKRKSDWHAQKAEVFAELCDRMRGLS